MLQQNICLNSLTDAEYCGFESKTLISKFFSNTFLYVSFLINHLLEKIELKQLLVLFNLCKKHSKNERFLYKSDKIFSWSHRKLPFI
jgi:hypothetical protein